MANLCLEEIGPLLGEFSDRVESWQADHAQAMRCRDLEDVLVFGISVHLAISIVDVNWHDAMFRGNVEYNPVEETELTNCYRAWLRPAEFFFVRLAQMEEAGYEVKWAEQFRRAYRAVKGAQAPDVEFFVGDSLIEMRDQAIDAHRGGRAVEMHELGG